MMQRSVYEYRTVTVRAITELRHFSRKCTIYSYSRNQPLVVTDLFRLTLNLFHHLFVDFTSYN